jgi:GntR family transcriptional repressor for pyruvate dehydrogenase complex
MTAVHLVRPRTNSLLIRTLEREPVSNQHRLMYEKIRDRDPAGAVAAFEAHFDHLVDVQRRALLDQDSRTLPIPEEAHPTPEVLRRRSHDAR